MLTAIIAGLMLVPLPDVSILTVPVFALAQAAEITPQEQWIKKLIQCESRGHPNIKILDTDGYYSYGILQFHMSTWLKYGKELGATKANIYDPELQTAVARQMLDAGGQNHWFNCSKRLGNYPVTQSSSGEL